MSDEMKLLMALCEALGFDVEKDVKPIEFRTEEGDIVHHSTITEFKLTKKEYDS